MQRCLCLQDRQQAKHDKQQRSLLRRSDFLMILAAVRNGMAVLLMGRPTVISLARGGMHGSCSRAEKRSVSWLNHAVQHTWTTARQAEVSW